MGNHTASMSTLSSEIFFVIVVIDPSGHALVKCWDDSSLSAHFRTWLDASQQLKIAHIDIHKDAFVYQVDKGDVWVASQADSNTSKVMPKQTQLPCI